MIQIESIKKHFAQDENPSHVFALAEPIPNFNALQHNGSIINARKSSIPTGFTDPPIVEVKKHPNPFFPHLYVPVMEERPMKHVMWP